MRIVFVILGICLGLAAFSQKKEDTARVKKRFFNNIFSQLKEAVMVSTSDSAEVDAVLKTKSEQPFLKYEGRTIRHIVTDQFGFEKSFADTSKRISYFGTRILNALHTTTKPWVIKDHLFIRENTTLNAYKVADNERYLRSLEFMQDARILVLPLPGSTDSVDLVVVTKDLFSITGGASVNGIKKVRTDIAETNLMGMGQRLEFSALVDRNREPSFGYAMEYTKNSIAGSFVNGSVGYTLINTGTSKGLEDEQAFYMRLERPLISPYSNIAGGVELSFNRSNNFYLKPDSLFFNYRYSIFDAWVGINIGTDRLMASKNEERKRRFVAVRYLQNNFQDRPIQIENRFDPIYNNKKGILGEITFFKQEFSKTNYIYGFGTTEDVPYGYNIALTGGWYKQLDLGRPYIGINANRYFFTGKGEFFQYFLRSGAFLNRKKLEDASILIGANLYSRLFEFKRFKLRDYLKFSYTNLGNRVTSEPLRIDNPLGLQYFRSDSVIGAQRLSIYTETYLISQSKLFGFQFSPFFFADLTLMAREKTSLFNSNGYTGLGGGLRTRNENLVFGTVEVRMIYFPRTDGYFNPFRINLKSNLRFRYNSRYIKAPDIIQLNNDESNNVY